MTNCAMCIHVCFMTDGMLPGASYTAGAELMLRDAFGARVGQIRRRMHNKAAGASIAALCSAAQRQSEAPSDMEVVSGK